MTEKYSLLTQLIKLARADGSVREEEYNFIVQLAWYIGVKRTEVDALFEQYIESDAPRLESDRIIQFHRLVLLAKVDHEIHEKELDFLRDVGMRMGLRPLAVEQVLREMEEGENGSMDPNRLIEIFQVYHN